MPGITYQQILKRMKQELDHALAHADQRATVRKHVNSIKVMAELITDDESNQEKVTPKYPSVADVMDEHNDDYDIDHEEANGDSIFDF